MPPYLGFRLNAGFAFLPFCASALSAAQLGRRERTCSFFPVCALAASTSSSLAITHVSAFMRASPSFLAITSNRQKINTELKRKLTPPPRAFGLASSHLHQTDKKAVFAALFRLSPQYGLWAPYFGFRLNTGFCRPISPFGLQYGLFVALFRPSGFNTGSGSGCCALRNTPSRGASAVFLIGCCENRSAASRACKKRINHPFAAANPCPNLLKAKIIKKIRKNRYILNLTP